MMELGKLVLAAGDEKRAAALLARAVELDPELDDAEYGLAECRGKSGDAREQWVHLGRAFELRGEMERARSAYEKALDLTPEDAPAHKDLEGSIKAIARVGTASPVR
jgi:tetratricopeptide (TPR) repeat protein